MIKPEDLDLGSQLDRESNFNDDSIIKNEFNVDAKQY